ncbi:MAG: hypothetical protein DMG06_25460 [Acidobacteria bacterium]|nr:MAG: hypothetical protein DMG06_25460 [Acidobacteriota bacterium]
MNENRTDSTRRKFLRGFGTSAGVAAASKLMETAPGDDNCVAGVVEGLDHTHISMPQPVEAGTGLRCVAPH